MSLVHLERFRDNQRASIHGPTPWRRTLDQRVRAVGHFLLSRLTGIAQTDDLIQMLSIELDKVQRTFEIALQICRRVRTFATAHKK